MKNLNSTLLIFALALGFCLTATAQTVNKGAWMIGGNVSFSSTSNDEVDIDITDFTLNPGAGYFIIDNLAVGLGLFYSSTKVGDNDAVSRTRLTPMARYYVFDAVYAQLGYGLEFDDDYDNTLAIGVGYSWFLSNNVAIEPMISYRIQGDNNTFGVGIGIQAFMGR